MNLEKNTVHDHNKYITTPECDKLTAENFAARLKQANLARKIDIANFVKKTDFNNKLKDVISNKCELYKFSNLYSKLKQYQEEVLKKI